MAYLSLEPAKLDAAREGKRKNMTKSTANQPDPARVHASALVIDTHADTPQRFVDESWDFSGPLAV